MCICHSIEGEGYLYDGEKKKWPNPRTWTDGEIYVWLVCKNAWYGTLDIKQPAGLAKGTRFRNIPFPCLRTMHPRLPVCTFYSHQLWKALEMGEATDVAAILRKDPSLLEKHLDHVCVCEHIGDT